MNDKEIKTPEGVNVFQFDEFDVEEIKGLYLFVFGHVPDWLNTSQTVEIKLNNLNQSQKSKGK